MKKEIGSEYWLEEYNQEGNLNYFNLGTDYKFLFSGRSALDYVLKNIDVNNKTVYMPVYCCESMVRPFLDNGYEIIYYNVGYDNEFTYDIDINVDCGIFMAMSYFGFSSSIMDKYIKLFKKKNKIVIEDITHRLFQKDNYCCNSDYLVASLRKWFPIYSGGLAVNVYEKFKVSTSDYKVDEELIRLKKMAMSLKKQYMNDEFDNKVKFLEIYQECNKLFLDYQDKLMDKESLDMLDKFDIKTMIQKRKENTEKIYKMLKNNSQIKLLFPYKENDCPLFVPILVNNRDIIKSKLLKENIYCPNHWPNFNEVDNNLYHKELSLICDHRYNLTDIEEYLNKLIKIVGE